MKEFHRRRIAAFSKRRRRNQPRRRRLFFEPMEPRLLLAADWQNPILASDVTGDGFVTPLDALVLINEWDARTVVPSDGHLPSRDTHTDACFYDTSGDDYLTPHDILLVINALNTIDVPSLVQDCTDDGVDQLASNLSERLSQPSLSVLGSKSFRVGGYSSVVAPVHLPDRIGTRLTELFEGFQPGSALASFDVQTSSTSNGSLSLRTDLSPLVVNGNRVAIEVVAAPELDNIGQLKADLVMLGMEIDATFDPFVSGMIAVEKLDDVAGLSSVLAVTPVLEVVTHEGAVTSEGVAALNADDVHSVLGIDGTGIRVGIISDSFDVSGDGSFAADIASGDLPEGVVIVQEGDASNGCFSGECIDEGRAMAQIVHDVAPGAELMFHTAGAGQAAMATAIRALADDGADIIVDDVGFFTAPMFMDGIIAQVVDQVVSEGVAYFSSAGNSGNDSYDATLDVSASNADFKAGSTMHTGTLHDFDSTPSEVDTFQKITIPDGAKVTISLQWNEPFGTHSTLR